MLEKSEKTLLGNIYQEFLRSQHHAFLIETNDRGQVFEYFRGQLLQTESSEENFFLNLQIFDIEKARELATYTRVTFATPHYLVLSFFSINLEAANAILKFLEEAAPNLKILLIVDTSTKLLPTILSRVYRLGNLKVAKVDTELASAVAKFLETPKANRLNLTEIKNLLAKKDEFAEEKEGKDRADREIMDKFLSGLYETIFQRYSEFLAKNYEREKSQKYLEFLDDITLALKYIKNNSSSPKTILEYLALKLPIIKF